MARVASRSGSMWIPGLPSTSGLRPARSRRPPQVRKTSSCRSGRVRTGRSWIVERVRAFAWERIILLIRQLYPREPRIVQSGADIHADFAADCRSASRDRDRDRPNDVAPHSLPGTRSAERIVLKVVEPMARPCPRAAWHVLVLAPVLVLVPAYRGRRRTSDDKLPAA